MTIRIILDFGRVLGLAALILTSSIPLHAHDGHEHEDGGAPHIARNVRNWTSSLGGHLAHGSYVATNDGFVQIRVEDETVVNLKLSQLSKLDRDWVNAKRAEIRSINQKPRITLISQQTAAKAKPTTPAPAIKKDFESFADKLELDWDKDFFYVGSNGMPDHPMMIGIRAWQQQVPLPKKYTGDNAWRIPLKPVPAKNPMSAKTNFFRGAIALAVNGIPIFNPIKNDGRTDTLVAGELDEYGGHCGRADDYHYHVAPVHLEPKLAKGAPLGYALDGYALLGYTEPDGSPVGKLDAMNGHEKEGVYHYHATKNYPYINGGFHGEVTERGGQVDPQPRAEGVRPDTRPLNGAKITDFKMPKAGSYSLTYELRGQKYFVNYTIATNGSVKFDFVDPSGKTTTETYQPRAPRPGGPGGGGPGGGGPPDGRPPRPGDPATKKGGRRPPPPPQAD